VHERDCPGAGDAVEVALFVNAGTRQQLGREIVAAHVFVVGEAAGAEDDGLAAPRGDLPSGVCARTPTTRPSSLMITPARGAEVYRNLRSATVVPVAR